MANSVFQRALVALGEPALVRQKRLALHEEDGKAGERDVEHAVPCVVAHRLSGRPAHVRPRTLISRARTGIRAGNLRSRAAPRSHCAIDSTCCPPIPTAQLRLNCIEVYCTCPRSDRPAPGDAPAREPAGLGAGALAVSPWRPPWLGAWTTRAANRSARRRSAGGACGRSRPTDRHRPRPCPATACPETPSPHRRIARAESC